MTTKNSALKPCNVWIAPLADKRKHCHQCEAAITDINRHLSVGEYIRGKFHNAFYACGECLIETVTSRIRRSTYTIVQRSGYKMPWYKQ